MAETPDIFCLDVPVSCLSCHDVSMSVRPVFKVSANGQIHEVQPNISIIKGFERPKKKKKRGKASTNKSEGEVKEFKTRWIPAPMYMYGESGICLFCRM